MATARTSAAGTVAAAEGLRERLARHLAAGSVSASNYDAMCRELARRRDEAHVECPDCEGLGFRPLPPEQLAAFAERMAAKVASKASWKTLERERWRLNRSSVCVTCRGCGYVRSKSRGGRHRPDSMWTTVQCRLCRGSGETWPPTDESAEVGDVCPDCLGDAYRVPITVRPRAKTAECSGYLEEEDLSEVRRCKEPEPATDAVEVIASMRATDPETASAVVVLLGPHGDRWAQHQWGRRFALWPLVPAGRQLLEEASTTSSELDHYLRQLEVLSSERAAEVQAERGNPRRRALIALADRQARLLESRVERAIAEIEAA